MKHSEELDDGHIAEQGHIQEKVALEEKYKLVKEKFKYLGADCQKILIQFYYDKKSMKDLQLMFNLSSEQAAKNKKSRCMKKLTEMVLQ